MKKLLFFIVIFAGCSSKIESNKKFVVISTFNEIVLETNSETEAYKTAHELTMLGRIFSSKPCYFVKEID